MIFELAGAFTEFSFFTLTLLNVAEDSAQLFQRDGKLEAYVATFPTAISDVHVLMDRFFTEGRRDFTGDPIMNQLRDQGEATDDLAKRKEIYRQALDRTNQNNYVLPLSNVPLIFTHVADLTIAEGSLGAYGAEIYDFNWK